MKVIQSAAYFRICTECSDKHGWIISAKGRSSDNCVTKRQAREILKLEMSEEHISTDEFHEVMRQINASSLPEADFVLEQLEALDRRISDIEDDFDEQPAEDSAAGAHASPSQKSRMN